MSSARHQLFRGMQVISGLCTKSGRLWHSTLPLTALSVLVLAGPSALAAQSSGTCSDSLFSSLPICQGVQQNSDAAATAATLGNQGQSSARSQPQAGNAPVYIDNAGSTGQRQTSETDRNRFVFEADPIPDLQRLTRTSTGELVPVFGRDLFQRAPSTFAPADEIPVTADYAVGPGDEVLVRLVGGESNSGNNRLTVDSSGNIYLPRVGTVHVAGLRASELQDRITTEVNRIFRNYTISVSLGQLRSIQVYLVGEARRPGAYTISGLSTLLNALFASGGPSVQGSMRHIQVRRGGQTLPEFDLYDLVLRGDKSRDLRLETGDTIFIPPVGPQVALAGSVRRPAIYELKGETTLDDVLKLAGGFSATGAPGQISLERIDTDLRRKATTVTLDAAGRGMDLRDGDVLYAGHISPAYEQSVTIRGNLANPGRFAWKPGMRLSDILPDRRSLLTNNYWRERNRLGVPVPLFQPMDDRTFVSQGAPFNNNQGAYGNNSQEFGNQGNNQSSNQSNDQSRAALQASRGVLSGQVSSQDALSSVLPPDADSADQNAGLAVGGVVSTTDAAADRSTRANATQGTQTRPATTNSVRIPAPEIDWSYAVIERLDPQTLKSTLVPFNLGRLVQDHDPAQNLELQPGDIVTILSQRDILVPQREQTKFVRLEGEFAGAGVYSVGPNETLDQLVRRAGGFTPQSYLYGSTFQRESARVFQQQRLNEYISQLSADMQRESAVRAASSATGLTSSTELTEERNRIEQLRQLRATGRVVLEFRPESMGTESVPSIPLENGDVFRVPSRPNTISVIGAVYGQNVFLYNSSRHLEDYLALAGKPNRVADKSHAFIIRADGSVYSRELAKGVFSNHFDDSKIYPGDSIVIPEKLIKPTVLRQLTDYSQILSSFGLAAAAINVVR